MPPLIHIPIIIFLLSLINPTSPVDCTVTATVTFNQCVTYCWQTYNGKKDFYNFNTGTCQQRIDCGKGYYNDWQNNICIDEFGGYVLKEIGWVVSVKEKHVMFTQLIMMNGYFVGNKIMCDDGWKSSMKTQKRNELTLIIYICDQEIKDGQIYPKTHGEYFFQKFTLQQKVYAIDYVLGVDNLSNFFTLKMNILLVFTCLYWFLNFLACCTSAGKKAKSKFTSKNKSLNKLTETQNKEIQEYLEKRKEERQKAMGDMKQFSLHTEIRDQLQIMKNIKQESTQILRKKWEKRREKKEKLKQQEKQKQIAKENKPISSFKFFPSKKVEQKQTLAVEKQKQKISETLKLSTQLSQIKQKQKKLFG